MDTETSATDSLNSPRSSFSGPSGSQRKERGAIAAQACDTCRSRKQKCDEKRPQCGTCQRFRLECQYREPQPTKKDKTLVEILDRLKSLEGKIDNLNLNNNFTTPAIYGTIPSSVIMGTVVSASTTLPPDSLGALALPAMQHSEGSSPAAGPSAGIEYSYVSGVHQMLGWSVVQQLLESSRLGNTGFNPASIEHDGAAIILGLHDASSNRLPTTPVGPLILSDAASSTHSAPSSTEAQFAGMPLSSDSMQILSKTYFETFNLVFPILDRQSFMSDVLADIFNDGFDDGPQSTLAFLVLALGEVAILGSQGAPVQVYNSRPSGVKGGTSQQPPGLALFNEARRRMGFNLTDCSLENVQIFALAGMYCESCSHHMEFWRMTATASLACQALVTGRPTELSSPRGELIRRCFWYCSIIENYFALELGLPSTGLEGLEDIVGPPTHRTSYMHEDCIGDQASIFQEYFASQMVLRRLSVEAHAILSSGAHFTTGAEPAGFTSTIKELSLRLDHWKAALSPQLRWRETRPAEIPNPTELMYIQTFFPSGRGSVAAAQSTSSAHSPTGFMFTTDLDAAPISYPYNMDVPVAILRSRYYHAKYLLHRPYVFKALSHPEQMTHDDAEGVSECFRACLKWPVAMSPTCSRKRLVPCLYFWTQNLMGILVLLHLSQRVPILLRIRTTLCGESFELEAGETVGLYMDWIRDLKCVDRAAQWAWEVVMAVYKLDE